MEKIIRIGEISIGRDHPVFVIAEAGVNHNGDIELAKRLVVEAKRAGADCVKFQTFTSERVVTVHAPKADYQLQTTDPQESQREMLGKLELTREEYVELCNLCRDQGITFLSTPYNEEDVDFLMELGIGAFKVASSHAIEHTFLRHVARKGKPLLVSTGMCTLAEVDEAVRVILQAGNSDIILLQCTTNYPSAVDDANLLAMVTMGKAFDVLVGYSDHTQNLTASTVAVGLGACVIEKHFTLDKTLPGPDHTSSADPKEFGQLVKQVREVELCLGSGLKHPAKGELENAVGMRRSIVARYPIPAGAVLSWKNLTLKRPATGFLGNQAQFLLGRRALVDIPADAIITRDMIA